jgi:hypothetical protein
MQISSYEATFLEKSSGHAVAELVLSNCEVAIADIKK